MKTRRGTGEFHAVCVKLPRLSAVSAWKRPVFAVARAMLILSSNDVDTASEVHE